MAVFASLLALASCVPKPPGEHPADGHSASRLSLITTEYGDNQKVEREFFQEFGREYKVKVDFLESFETVRSMVDSYQDLLRRHAPDPDLYEIDVVWPPLLANDLIDLKPYFKDEIKDFDPGSIRNFTVSGRLIALPTFIDTGVLYYRPDLLKRYGFHSPPATWTKLEEMARVIQAGERKKGNKDFWGYVWQGGGYEALTCNALEWQSAAGVPTFLSSDGSVHVTDPLAIATLKRATAWIGTISPPGEPWYRELDTNNFWSQGDAAFARNWTSAYSSHRFIGHDRTPFAIAAIPGGPGGQHGTLGGLGMGISKYSRHRDLAVQALRGLTSERVERKRVAAAAVLPTRIALLQDTQLMSQTSLRGGHAEQIIAGTVARPSTAAGSNYTAVSEAYFKAVNAVLTKKASAEDAMAALDARLNAIIHSPRKH